MSRFFTNEKNPRTRVSLYIDPKEFARFRYLCSEEFYSTAMMTRRLILNYIRENEDRLKGIKL